MAIRKIVEIDEEKCNGCGLCVQGCAEGAIQIVDGKARLVSDTYCDGLGACLGECPEGAIRIVEREAAIFDEAAVKRHLANATATPPTGGCPGSQPQAVHACPGSRAMQFTGAPSPVAPTSDTPPSQLANWPVQLSLASPQAPYFQNADLLLVADCVPFAFAGFHQEILRRQPVIIACPKLDNAKAHAERLAAILAQAKPRSLTVVHMEVPCCMGLVQIARIALLMAESDLDIRTINIGIQGGIKDGSPLSPARI